LEVSVFTEEDFAKNDPPDPKLTKQIAEIRAKMAADKAAKEAKAKESAQ
jgi:hypothetical protein